jgi:6-phosphofructokinase
LSTPQEVDNALRSLEYLRIRYLVTIGGVETANSAHLISEAAKAAHMELSVVHTPKTVYNDLPVRYLFFGFRVFSNAVVDAVGMYYVRVYDGA